MLRIVASVSVATVLAFAPLTSAIAQDAKVPPSSKLGAPVVKAGKGEKVCGYKFPGGEKRSWVCKKEEPCCAWDAISYVKCGSTVTGCL